MATNRTAIAGTGGSQVADPCIYYDLSRVEPWAEEPLRRIFNFLNLELKPYIDARTSFQEGQFEPEELAAIAAQLPMNWSGDMWILINNDAHEIVHGTVDVVESSWLDGGGAAVAQIHLDARNHVVGVGFSSIYDGTPPGGGGDECYWCRIVGNGSIAASYSVTEVERTNAGGWQDLAGGLSGVDALNLAEEAAGTNALAAHTAADPNVVLVFTEEDEDGDAVYCFRRVAGLIEVPFHSICSTGAKVTWDLEIYHTEAGLFSERRLYFKFPQPVDSGSIGTLMVSAQALGCVGGLPEGLQIGTLFNFAAGPAENEDRHVTHWLMAGYATADFNNPAWGAEPAIVNEFMLGGVHAAGRFSPSAQGWYVSRQYDSHPAGTPIYGIRLRMSREGLGAGTATTWGTHGYVAADASPQGIFLAYAPR